MRAMIGKPNGHCVGVWSNSSRRRRAFDPTASAVGWQGPMRIDRRRFIHTPAAAVAGLTR